MKKIFFIGLIIITTNAFSQNDSVTFLFKANADIASRYVWRGADYFNSPAIQPDMEIVYKNHIGIGAWGSVSIDNQPVQETDWFVFANIYKFSLYLYDYFFMNQTINNHYFDYNSSTTGHTLSADLSYTISDKFPLTMLVAYNFYGNDSLNSTYVEFSYAPKKYPLQIFCGGTFDKGWYGNQAGIVNAGIQIKKDIEINNKLSLPLKLQCIVNPMTGNIYIVAILSL